jgi:hypothetical protein
MCLPFKGVGIQKQLKRLSKFDRSSLRFFTSNRVLVSFSAPLLP